MSLKPGAGQKRVLILLVFVALLSPTITHAQPKTVWSNASCKDWLEASAKEKAAKEPLDWIVNRLHVRWIMGFLTALNVAGGVKKDALANINTNLVRDWTDNYCRKNLNADISDAAGDLFLRLAK